MCTPWRDSVYAATPTGAQTNDLPHSEGANHYTTDTVDLFEH